MYHNTVVHQLASATLEPPAAYSYSTEILKVHCNLPCITAIFNCCFKPPRRTVWWLHSFAYLGKQKTHCAIYQNMRSKNKPSKTKTNHNTLQRACETVSHLQPTHTLCKLANYRKFSCMAAALNCCFKRGLLILETAIRSPIAEEAAWKEWCSWPGLIA